MIRPKLSPARVVAFGGVAFLACRLAAAVPAGDFSFASTGRLQAGSTLTVSWTLDLAAAPDADEMELVLSLDGGVTFPIRLTGRIVPETRSLVWRVPALPTEHGRIAMRAGSGEEADTEEVLFSSQPFAIDAPPGFPGEDLFSIKGEWRTREALEGPPVRPLARDLEPGGASPNLEPLDLDESEIGTGPADVGVLASQSTATRVRTPGSPLGARRAEASFRASLPLRL